MSTVTRIKGVINNYGLPILTNQGLLPYWEGKFINNLEEQGYVLSSDQKKAVTDFLSSITEKGIVNAVRYMWPFFGNSSNVNAAKVPLIGEKRFDFGSSFTDFVYNSDNDVIGITKCPAISSLNTLDFCDEHCMSVAASFVKADTYAHEAEITKVINVGDAVQIRPIQMTASVERFGLYLNTTNGKDLFLSPFVPDNFNDAGNLYMAMALNDQNSTPYYMRYMKVNDGSAKYGSGKDTNRVYAAPTQADSAKTLSAISDFGSIVAMTGLVVFNRVLEKSELKSFMDAFKDMNIALGKEVSV